MTKRRGNLQVCFCLLMTVSLIFLMGCYVPEQFEARLHIKKDGTFSFKYDGIITHALLRKALLEGEPDLKDPIKIRDMENDFRKDKRLKEVSYLGNAQFKIVWEANGVLDEPFYFFSKDDILSVVPKTDTVLEVTTFSVTAENLKIFSALKMKVNGKFEVTTDADVISHNGKAGLISGAYTWHIASPSDPAPAMLIRLPEKIAKGTRPFAGPSLLRPASPSSPSKNTEACAKNLQAIEGAKEQWALENRKRDGAPVNETQVDEYIKGGHPKCPSGGNYIYNVIGRSPVCNAQSHSSAVSSSTFDRPGAAASGNAEPDEATKNKLVCHKQLDELDEAKEQWAKKFKRRRGGSTDWKVLRDFSGKDFGDCPDRGTHTLTQVGFPSTCSAHPR